MICLRNRILCLLFLTITTWLCMPQPSVDRVKTENLRHFNAISDIDHLPRLLTLLDSLERVYHDFKFHVLALDQDTLIYLKLHPKLHVELYSLEQIETAKRVLLEAKKNRTGVEYIFTMAVAFPTYLMETQEMDIITTIDTDTYFYKSPEAVFSELVDAMVTPHRFSATVKAELVHFGYWNGGWISFRRTGLDILQRWYTLTVQHCRDEITHNEDGRKRFAEQGYLEWLMEDYRGRMTGINNSGINVGPWGLEGIEANDVVHFHFHCLRVLSSFLYRWCLFDNYIPFPAKPFLHQIYRPYIRDLRRNGKIVKKYLSNQGFTDFNSTRHPTKPLMTQLKIDWQKHGWSMRQYWDLWLI
jgi:hypothetical protein